MTRVKHFPAFGRSNEKDEVAMLKKWFLFLGLFAGGVCAASEFDEMLACPPTVCAVGREYQIMVPVTKPTLMWCEVGGQIFYDESNGIVRSDTDVHRLIVPQELLDKATIFFLKAGKF